MKIKIIIVWALLCAVFASPHLIHMAQAATWTVNSLDDSSDGACNATNCTLREAITAANAATDADLIDFASGVTGTLMLSSALPALNTDISIQGPGAEVLAISGSGTETPNYYTAWRIFSVTGGTVVIRGLTIKKGYVSGNGGGGGVLNSGTLTIENSVLSDNFAPQGGAICNTGTLTVSDCSLINNSAGQGGGIANILNVSGNIVRGFATVNRCVLSGNAAVTRDNQGYSYFGQGGGLYTDGKLTVNASTIKGNSAAHGGGVYSYHSMLNLFDSTLNNNSAFTGGGVFCINDHPLYSSTIWITTMRNCTLSGNAAYNGSGFYNFTGLSIIESCTIANSTTLNNGSGGGLVSEISQNRPTETKVRHTLIAGNFNDDVRGVGFVSQGYNLVGYGNAGSFFNQPGDQITGNWQVKPLADNGGPTQTHALLPDSLAFNAGDPAFSSPPDFDQRGAGFPRVRGGRIDIGAFEAAALLMNNVEVTESSQGATATFSVSLESPSDQSITLNYNTVDTAGSTASASRDYDVTTGTLVFAPGATSKTFSVRVNDDTQDEANEWFRVQVSAPDNPEIGIGRATCTILDNDDAPSLTINDITVVEGSDSFVTAEFTVSLSVASGQRVSVNVLSSDGEARSPDDYQRSWDTLTFWPGETTQTFRVTIVGDLLYEADESFYALLSSPVNASISRERGIGTITNDDADTTAPTVSFTTSATTPAGTTPVNGSTIFNTMPVITGTATDSGSGIAKVILRLYRLKSGTTNAYEYWDGTNWISTVFYFTTTLNPATGGANVSWSKGGGWPTGGNLTDGTYYMVATAYDKANKTAAVSSSFKVLNDSAAPTVRFTTSATTPVGTTPVSGSTIYHAMPAITGEAADSGSGIAKIELRLHRVVNSVVEFWNGTSWGATQVRLAATLNPATGGANVSWSKGSGWPGGANLSENTYYLTAYATDKVAKVASASSNFKVLSDTTAPTVSFTTASTTPAGTTPVNGSTIYNAMPTITGVAADSGSGVAKLELRLHRVVNSVVEFWNGTAWGTTQVKLAAVLNPTTGGANVSWSKSDGWPTGANLTENTYYLTAYAYDKVGKVVSASSNFKKATNTSGSTSGSEMFSASDVKFSAGEAWVSNQSIRLSFSGALEQVTAENRANYHVSISTPVSISQAVTVKSASYDKATRIITLLLAEGSLETGDTVSVKWSLRDGFGAPLNGQAELQAQ